MNGLGRGRFTRVYLAKDTSGTTHVLKYFPEPNAHMGHHERNILVELANSHILNVPRIEAFLPMDLASALLISPVGLRILPAPKTVSITPNLFIQLLDVIVHVHQLGIIHRDIKPENIYLNANDPRQVILADWGSAVKTFNPTYLEAEPCTYQGTPLYGEQHIIDQLQIPTKQLDLRSLVKTVFSIKQQKNPNCGKEWPEIENYWNSVSRDFPEFRNVLYFADTMNSAGLRDFFQKLWC